MGRYNDLMYKVLEVALIIQDAKNMNFCCHNIESKLAKSLLI